MAGKAKKQSRLKNSGGSVERSLYPSLRAVTFTQVLRIAPVALITVKIVFSRSAAAKKQFSPICFFECFGRRQPVTYSHQPASAFRTGLLHIFHPFFPALIRLAFLCAVISPRRRRIPVRWYPQMRRLTFPCFSGTFLQEIEGKMFINAHPAETFADTLESMLPR